MAGKMSPKFVALCSLAVGAIYSTGYAVTADSGKALASATIPQSHANLSVPSKVNPSTGSNKSTANATEQTTDQNSTSNRTTTNTSETNSTSTTNTSATNATKSSNTATQSSSSNHTSSSSTSKTSSQSNTSNSNTVSSTASSAPVQQFLDGTYNGSSTNRIGTVSVAVTIRKGKIANVQITACDTHYPESYINPVLPNYVVQNQSINVPIISGATLSTADFYYAVVQALTQAKNPNYKG